MLLTTVLFASPCPLLALGTDDARLLALVQQLQARIETARTAAWPDLSAEGIQRLEADDRATLVTLHTIRRRSLRFENHDLYDLFEWSIDQRMEEMHARLYLTPFCQDRRLFPAGGPLGALDPLWLLPQPVTLSDYRERIRRLDALPEYVKQAVELLHEAEAAHMLPARELAWQSTIAGRRWLNDRPGLGLNSFVSGTRSTGAERTLYAPFASMPGVDAEQARLLRDAARKTIRERVIPAVRQYYDELYQRYLPACPESPSLAQWPDGKEVYRLLLRRSTKTDLSPYLIQAFGIAEVKRIRQAITVVAATTGFKASLDEFLAQARTDRAFYFDNDEQLLIAYRSALQDIERVLPKVVHTVPQMTIRVEAVRGGAAAYCEAPNTHHEYDLVNIDVSTPSIHPKFEVIPLMLHEGVPGHALQHAVERDAGLAEESAIAAFVRQAQQSTGFAEGWGSYSEALGHDLGLYRTTMDEFGALRMQLTRAVRVVVDTGVHLSGWTLERAKDYAAANTGEPEQQINLEVGRTIRPGVEPAYSVGARQIEHMRTMVARKLGPSFDLASFNDAILRWGPLPLEIMRRKLEECLNDRKCSQTFQPPQ